MQSSRCVQKNRPVASINLFQRLLALHPAHARHIEESDGGRKEHPTFRSVNEGELTADVDRVDRADPAVPFEVAEELRIKNIVGYLVYLSKHKRVCDMRV